MGYGSANTPMKFPATMALSSKPADPPSTASAGTAAPRNPPPPTRDPSPRAPPFHQSLPHYYHTNSLPSQQQQPVYTVPAFTNLAPRVPANGIHSQLAVNPHDPPQGILYPVASSGRGFLPNAFRPQSAEQAVKIAKPSGVKARPAITAAYVHRSYPVQAFGIPHPDPQGQAVHLTRPTHQQHAVMGSNGGMMLGTSKGVPVSTRHKVAPSQLSVSKSNGYKELRNRSKDDSFMIVRDRKVKISESGSLYAMCRSWLRNGFPEESQRQNVDSVKSLPKPSPTAVVDSCSQMEKEGDKEVEEEEEGSIDLLSRTDLLQRHIKHAKMVRARLREERQRRIARYKTRLALLLPPLLEQQQFRNDMAAGT